MFDRAGSKWVFLAPSGYKGGHGQSLRGRLPKGDDMDRQLAAISVSQSFQNLMNTVIGALWKIPLFLVILVIGWLVARVLMQAVPTLLRMRNVDNFVQPAGVGQLS